MCKSYLRSRNHSFIQEIVVFFATNNTSQKYFIFINWQSSVGIIKNNFYKSWHHFWTCAFMKQCLPLFRPQVWIFIRQNKLNCVEKIWLSWPITSNHDIMAWNQKVRNYKLESPVKRQRLYAGFGFLKKNIYNSLEKICNELASFSSVLSYFVQIYNFVKDAFSIVVRYNECSNYKYL